MIFKKIKFVYFDLLTTSKRENKSVYTNPISKTVLKIVFCIITVENYVQNVENIDNYMLFQLKKVFVKN